MEKCRLSTLNKLQAKLAKQINGKKKEEGQDEKNSLKLLETIRNMTKIQDDTYGKAESTDELKETRFPLMADLLEQNDFFEIEIKNDTYDEPTNEQSNNWLAHSNSGIQNNVSAGIKQENTSGHEPANEDNLYAMDHNRRNLKKSKLENVMYVEATKDDNILYCVECKQEHNGECPVHGPLIVIQNMKVEENDPDRALHSLPPNLLVKESDITEAGLGVFTDTEIQPGTTYGPYEGMYITDPELANASGYCWQIYKDGEPSHLIDGKDTASSNWMRYVNCALSAFDQNLTAFQYKGEIYYRCIKPILPKTELLVWYGDDYARKLGIYKDKNTADLMPMLPTVEVRTVGNRDGNMDITVAKKKLKKSKDKGKKVSKVRPRKTRKNTAGDSSRKISNKKTLSPAVELVNKKKKSTTDAPIVCAQPTLIPFVKDGPDKDFQMELQIVLSQEEEIMLAKWVASMAVMGLEKTKQTILDTVEAIIKKEKRSTPFLNDWYDSFLNHFPNLSQRANISREITNISLKSALTLINGFLEEECSDPLLWKDPSRWFDAGELGFTICPKSKKVLPPKKIINFAISDTQITVQACMNAAGFFLKPLIVFPVQKMSNEPLSGFPGASYGRTETGRIDSDLFVAWLRKVFSPTINEKGITRPVVLFVNCDSSHTSFAVSKFCQENQIILCCLFGYSRKALQLCDISIFRSLNEKWKKSVLNYRMVNNGDTVTVSEFVKVFKPAWEKACKTNIGGSFKKYLFPFSLLKALLNVEERARQNMISSHLKVSTLISSGNIKKMWEKSNTGKDSNLPSPLSPMSMISNELTNESTLSIAFQSQSDSSGAFLFQEPELPDTLVSSDSKLSATMVAQKPIFSDTIPSNASELSEPLFAQEPKLSDLIQLSDSKLSAVLTQEPNLSDTVPSNESELSEVFSQESESSDILLSSGSKVLEPVFAPEPELSDTIPSSDSEELIAKPKYSSQDCFISCVTQGSIIFQEESGSVSPILNKVWKEPIVIKQDSKSVKRKIESEETTAQRKRIELETNCAAGTLEEEDRQDFMYKYPRKTNATSTLILKQICDKRVMEKKRKRMHSNEVRDPEQAELVNTKNISTKHASTVYDISESTHTHFVKVGPGSDCQMEPRTVLSQEEENILAKWIDSMSRMGLNKTKNDVLETVEMIVNEGKSSTPLKGQLVANWFSEFLKCHPELSLTGEAQVFKDRYFFKANRVSESWFHELENFIAEECNDPSLWKDPSRWFNANELAFPICRVSKTVRNPKRFSGINQITVQACMNAAGFFFTPLIVFADQIFPGFPGASFSKTATGCVSPDLFVAWLRDVFSPTINEKGIPKPVVLFVDWHASHTSFAVSKFCQENQIILYCLVEHSRKSLHPCDIALFSSLKEEWKKSVKRYLKANNGDDVTISKFAKVFKPAWDTACTTEAAEEGFKKSNLFPFEKVFLIC